MRIASYNLFEGAQNTQSELKEFVAEQELDVLCIQEANGWAEGEPTRLEEFAEATGLNTWAYGDSNTRFKLATFSGSPMLASKAHTDGFWHSAVHSVVQTNGEPLHVWNVHLNPGNEDERLAEAKLLMSLINQDEQTIITGDFNSLSRADQYPEGLIDDLTAKGITKFGTNALRYDVTDFFTNAGLIDIAVPLSSRTNTVPTPANQDVYHAAELRLDYMFVTQGLAKAIKSIEVVKSPLTEVISDHYPLVVTL
ncbi:MAG: endonuclease/exonuclease/phosphatase family protein [Candidatus Saccharibacteria bacterium]